MKRYSKKKKEKIYREVLYIIDIILGKQQYIKKEDNKMQISTGLRPMLKYIYTKGDCGRFALLLYNIFKRYNPSIYHISWINEKTGKSNFHFVTKILDKYFDAYGTISKNLQNSFNHKIKITKVTNKWLEDKKNIDILTGNFEFHRIIMEMLKYVAFHEYSLKTLYENNEFKLIGFNRDKLTNIFRLFEEIKEKHLSIDEWNEEIGHLNFIEYENQKYTKEQL